MSEEEKDFIKCTVCGFAIIKMNMSNEEAEAHLKRIGWDTKNKVCPTCPRKDRYNG